MATVRSAPNDSRAAEPLCASRLRAVIAASEPLLAALPEAETARRPAPGKGSAREVIGHLIDFNRHLARVMAAIPEPIRSRPRSRHNLNEIARRLVP